ncbi:MAG: response regulator transcription factor [Oligoflexia bacterium]|nr:response regulator transcription factor [Oligoflexia bacterium]
MLDNTNTDSREIKQIMIVEDDQDILEAVSTYLQEHEEYNVISFSSGEMFLSYFKNSSLVPDFLILDILLPGILGIDVCRKIRQNKITQNIPILMLTALATAEHIVRGLDAGADDYVTKPFDMIVLLARVRALLRRNIENISPNIDDIHAINSINSEKKSLNIIPSSLLNFHSITLDQGQHRVYKDKDELNLTLMEFKLLSELIKSKGKVLTRTKLLKSIVGNDIAVTHRTIDTHMVSLRKKLGDHAAFIEAVRGVGYRTIL